MNSLINNTDKYQNNAVDTKEDLKFVSKLMNKKK